MYVYKNETFPVANYRVTARVPGIISFIYILFYVLMDVLLFHGTQNWHSYHGGFYLLDRIVKLCLPFVSP